MVFVSLCLTSLSMIISWPFHIAPNGIISLLFSFFLLFYCLFHSFFSWLSSIPLYKYTTSSLLIHLSMDIQVLPCL